MDTGEFIRCMRVKRGMTQTALAVKAGVSRSLLAKVERGTSNPSLRAAQGIAAALDVPFSRLVGEDWEEPAEEQNVWEEETPMRVNIDVERVRLRMPKHTLAKTLGVTVPTLAGYVAGSSIPSSKLEKMADLFGVSTDYLLGRTDRRDP